MISEDVEDAQFSHAALESWEPTWGTPLFKRLKIQDYPGGPVVKTLPFQCRGRRFSS